MSRQLFGRLSRESFVYGLSASAAKLIGIILVPLYTHSLVRADFGLLDLLISGTGILAALLILGLDSAAAITFYQTGDPRERRVIASTLLYFELGLSSAVCGVLFLLARPLAEWLSVLLTGLLVDVGTLTGYIQVGVSTIPFAVFMTIFLDIARLIRLPVRYLVLSGGNLLLTALCIIVAVVWLHLGVAGVLAGTLLGNAGFSVIGWLLTRPQYTLTFSPAALRRMLALGLPLVPATIAYWVITFSNRWFLSNIVSLDQAGLLTLATRLIAPVVLVVTAFQIAWVPFSLSIAREEAASRVYARTLLYFLALTFGTLLLLVLAARPLILLFAPASYLPAAAVLAPVGLSSIAYGAYYIVATGVNLSGRTVHIGWTTGVAALVSIALNLALIPAFGVQGAALAGLGANLIPVVLLYFIAQRVHAVPYDLPRAVLLAAVGCGLLAAATLMPPMGILADLALRSGLLLAFVAALAGLGIIRGQEIEAFRQMLRRVVRLGSNP